MTATKIVIIGGVAGGANVATRARRLSESAEIVLIERGPYISFANCGLPYHIGGEIPSRNSLLVQTPEDLKRTFQIDVRVRHEAIAIDRETNSVWIRDLATGNASQERYDHLVLATGATPLRPDVPGIDLPGIFGLRNIADMDRINEWLAKTQAKTAIVAGAGFVGLEVAEQLHRRGLSVTVIESADHVLPSLDLEIAAPVNAELEAHGVNVILNDAVAGFERDDAGQLSVATVNGAQYTADIAILSVGIRPLADLARSAGLELNRRGAVVVNEFLQTSDPNIWAAGDLVQLRHRVSGKNTYVPLAGPASRAGRLIADNILGERRAFAGPLGTAIIRVFDLAAACTGLNERALQDLQIPYKAVHVHPNSHAKYFPGSERLVMKLLFAPSTGILLGAQAVGKRGVDKRIDVLATAIAGNMTVEDLADLDLCYAPPFGSSKDPINLAGMAAANIRAGLVDSISWHELPSAALQSTILDVRNQSERERGAIAGSIHIPLAELRARLSEIPSDRHVLVYCHSGQRSYTACRILSHHGYRCTNLSGSYATWSAAHSGRSAAAVRVARAEANKAIAAR